MVTQKDWNTFTEMYDIDSDHRREKWLREVREQQEYVRKHNNVFARFGMTLHMQAFDVTNRPKYPRSTEGCMDWIKDGRPVFARKLRV